MLKKILFLILFFICMGINIYFRLLPAYFPQLKKEAQVKTEEKIRQDAFKKVEELYPDFNPLAKNEIVKEITETEKKTKKIKEEVEEEYEKLKDKFQDDRGQTYLLEFDSYHWMRYIENILKNDHPGDKKVGGQSYDSYMLAPMGTEIVYARFSFYLAAFLYRTFSFLFESLPLTKFLFYLPVFYAFVFLTLLYLFCRYIFSDLAAFFCTLFVGLSRLFLFKSCAGWFDYDSLALIFPLVIAWLLISALRNKEKIKKLIFYSVLASFFLGLYAYTWVGWWFIFIVVGIAFIIGLANTYLINYKEKEKTNRGALNYLVSGSIFLAGGIAFCIIVAHINPIKFIFDGIKQNLNLGTPLFSSIWPNIYYTVGELQKANAEAMVEFLHGSLPFALSLIGMLWIYIKEKRSEKKDFLNIMFFWTIFMLFASLKARRFVIFLSLPLGLFFGGFVDEIAKIIKVKLSHNLKGGLIGLIIFLIASCWIIDTFIKEASTAANSIYPIMNDSWSEAMTYIKKNTPENSIINSWWDYGNIFETEGKRRVIFDNQSQNRPLAFWMAQVLLSADEEEAIRILRMLNNASDKTFDLLNQHIKDPFKSIVILEKLLASNAEDAKDILEKAKIPSHLVKKILDGLYKKPPPAYFIVEGSMILKMPSISFLGNWNFKKLYVRKNIYKNKEEILEGLNEIFNLTPDESKDLYEEDIFTSLTKEPYEGLSQRLKFYSSSVKGAKGEERGNIVYFDNDSIYDLNLNQILFFSPKESKYKIPENAFVFREGNFKKMSFKDSNTDMSVLVILEDDKYSSMFLDEELANSLFVHLYFLKGKKLKFFEPFYSDDEACIYVYRIKWEEFNE